jgi:hypothetical protein
MMTVMTDSANHAPLGAGSIAETMIAQARDDKRACRMTPTMKRDQRIEFRFQTGTATNGIKSGIVSPRAMS